MPKETIRTQTHTTGQIVTLRSLGEGEKCVGVQSINPSIHGFFISFGQARFRLRLEIIRCINVNLFQANSSFVTWWRRKKKKLKLRVGAQYGMNVKRSQLQV